MHKRRPFESGLLSLLIQKALIEIQFIHISEVCVFLCVEEFLEFHIIQIFENRAFLHSIIRISGQFVTTKFIVPII